MRRARLGHNDARVHPDAGCYVYASPIRMKGDFGNDTLRERWEVCRMLREADSYCSRIFNIPP
jgi:hypothetical protein